MLRPLLPKAVALQLALSLLNLHCLQLFHYKSHVAIFNFLNWLWFPETESTYSSNEVKNEIHRYQKMIESEI